MPLEKESRWKRPWVVLVGAFAFGTAGVTAWGLIIDKPEMATVAFLMFAAMLFFGGREHRKGVAAAEQRVRDDLEPRIAKLKNEKANLLHGSGKAVTAAEQKVRDELEPRITKLEEEKANLARRLEYSKNEIKLMREGEEREIRQRKKTLAEVIRLTATLEQHVSDRFEGKHYWNFQAFDNLLQYGLPKDERYEPLRRVMEKARDFAMGVEGPPLPRHAPVRSEGVMGAIHQQEASLQHKVDDMHHGIYSDKMEKEADRLAAAIIERAEALLAAP